MTMMDLKGALSYRDALELLDLVQAMTSFASVDLQMGGMRISVEAGTPVAAPPLVAREGALQGRIVASPGLGLLRFGCEVASGSSLAAGAQIGIVATLDQETALKAEETCTVVEVLVANGSFVEYGQPVLRVAGQPNC